MSKERIDILDRKSKYTLDPVLKVVECVFYKSFERYGRETYHIQQIEDAKKISDKSFDHQDEAEKAWEKMKAGFEKRKVA